MTIDEAIKNLEYLKREIGRGDLELVGLQDIGDAFAIDWGRIFDIIEVSNEDDSLPGALVCAFMEPACEHEIERPSHLKLVK